MSITTRLGRPMMAVVFITDGIDQIRFPERRADALESAMPVGVGRAVEASSLPNDATDLIRLSGTVQLCAGVMLAANRFPRLAAMALAASLVPSTYANHRFWAERSDARGEQRMHFLKNTAMLGGLLIAAGDTGGRPSVGYLARRRLRRAAARGGPHLDVREVIDRLPDGHDLASTASEAVGAAAERAGEAAVYLGGVGARRASDARRGVGHGLVVAAGALSHAASRASRRLRSDVVPAAVGTVEQLRDHLPPAADIVHHLADRDRISSLVQAARRRVA